MSVMVPRLKEIDPIPAYPVNNSVFLSQPPGPDPRADVFERLRLPNPVKGVAKRCLHQVHRPEGNPSIYFDPVTKVLSKFGMENGIALHSPRLGLKPYSPG